MTEKFNFRPSEAMVHYEASNITHLHLVYTYLVSIVFIEVYYRPIQFVVNLTSLSKILILFLLIAKILWDLFIVIKFWSRFPLVVKL